jgi:dTMP kinase
LKGLFVTLEGIEGCGKTTQGARLKSYLEERNIPVVLTREPGGTAIGEKIRKMLIDPENKDLLPLTEVLLFSAARHQHVREVILPALARGDVVICDRFYDATFAYQGSGRGLENATLKTLTRLATEGLKPDLTIVLDLDPGEGMKRLLKSRPFADRIEKEAMDFFLRVREGYLAIASREKKRCRVFDAAAEEEAIHRKIAGAVMSRWSRLEKG